MYSSLSINLITKSLFRTLSFKYFSSKIPKHPVFIIDTNKLPKPTKIDKETIDQLEKISLVNFESSKGIEIVEEAIRFADQLFLVNTENIEPLITVLQDKTLTLRDDIINDGNCHKEILKNAKEIEDDYFVAPPGNVPLETKDYGIKVKN